MCSLVGFPTTSRYVDVNKHVIVMVVLDFNQPGLVAAVSQGNKRVVDKYKAFWCNTEAVVSKVEGVAC